MNIKSNHFNLFRLTVSILLAFTQLQASAANEDIDSSMDSLLSEITSYQQTTFNILQLNSYHDSYKWTSSLNSTIKQSLDSKGIEYELYIHNLDTKRIGTREKWKAMTQSILDYYPPGFLDIIIATDDNALNSLIDNNIRDIPIVFCGVSDYQKDRFADYSNITGIVQIVNIQETISLALKLFPDTNTIAFISDNTHTGKIYNKLAQYTFLSHPEVDIVWLDGTEITTKELLSRLHKLPKSCISILGIWQKDTANIYCDMEKIYPQISQASTSPVFAISDLGIGYGVIGGKLPSAEGQGKNAVDMVTEILLNPSRQIPPLMDKVSLDNKFDYRQLVRWGLQKADLPVGSIIINKPAELSTELVVFIWTSSIIIALLFLSITSLIIYITRYKRIKGQQAQKDHENSLIMNSLPLWCGIISTNGEILFSNEKVDIEQDAMFTKWLENCPEIIEKINTTVSKNNVNKMQFEYDNRIIFGILKPVDYNNYRCDSIVFIAIDITDKVKAQKQTEEINNLLNLAMQVGKSCYWIWDVTSFTIETNQNFWLCQGINDRTDSTFNISEFWQHINPNDEDTAREKLNTIAENKASSCQFECRLNFTGEDVWFYLQAEVLERDSDGLTLRAGVYMSNISSIKQIELQLIEMNTQLMDAQEMSKIGNWTIDIDKHTVTASPTFYKIFGIPCPPNGTCNRALIRPRIINYNEYIARLDSMNTIGDSSEGYLYIYDSNKNIKTLWTIGRYGINERNQPIYFGIVQDVTERMEMENELKNSEQYLIQAANLAKMYYWSYDAQSEDIVYYNSSSVWGENNIDGQQSFDKIFPYIHPEDLKQTVGLCKKAFAGQLPHGTMNYRMLINGVTKHLTTNWESYYNQDNTLESILGISIDVTEQKDKELLEIAQKEMEATAKAKGQFLATMSHEIRTPINVVIGMNHLLQETELDDVQYNFVTKIDRAANALLGIINDILDISKIEENKLAIENIEFSPRDIIYNNTSILASGAEQNNVEMHIKIDQAIPMRLIGDPLRISQILTNLLSNAVKFTDKGDITLGVNLVSQQNNTAIIEFAVTDSGIGIRQECLDKLFKPYSQAEASTSRKFGGTGLGLAICKQLAELMGGTIEATSTEGQGSCFTVRLPFNIPVNIKENPSYQIPELTGKNALIVDDNHNSLEIISELIISTGFSVTLASNGKEAVEIVNNSGKVFDLIILDWMMPDMNGIETLKEIQQSNISREPHFISVTSHNKENIIQDCIANGFSSVIGKPVNPDELIISIRKAFGLSVSAPSKKNKDLLPNLAGTSILLVEDQELNQEIMLNLLSKTKTKVTIANNGVEAVDKVKANSFDLILMDIQMPEMNGLEATKAIRKISDKKLSNIPILAMTANAMQEDVENSRLAGMNDHITKPINPSLLYKKIKEYICQPVDNKNHTIDKLQKIDSLNTFDGIKYAGGDKEVFINTLSKFVDITPKQLEKINDAIKAGDTNTLSEMIHTLKGSAGTIGAQSLMLHADTLENSLMHNLDNNIETELESIISEIENLKCEIEQALNNNEKGGKDDVPLSERSK